jgi:hypothetical protein
MNINDIIIARELVEAIGHKNKLLKCLNTSYTSALEFIKSENYGALLNSLDEQNILLAEINDSDSKIPVAPNDYEKYRDKVISCLSSCKVDNELQPVLIKVAAEITIYKKLLRNSKFLNEKLTYQVREAKIKAEQDILALKNRKLIKSGYNTYHSPKAGLVIDYKNN